MTARWEAVLDAVGRKKRMLREALGHAVPVAVEGGVLRLAVTDAVHLDGLERGRGAISQAVAEVAGHAVQVVLEAGGAERRAPAPAPPRLDQQTDRDERLRVYRGKDPALDRAADLLDLELTE